MHCLHIVFVTVVKCAQETLTEVEVVDLYRRRKYKRAWVRNRACTSSRHSGCLSKTQMFQITNSQTFAELPRTVPIHPQHTCLIHLGVNAFYRIWSQAVLGLALPSVETDVIFHSLYHSTLICFCRLES